VERDLVDKASFERLMAERGISNDTTVILCGDKNNWFAAYAYWYLKTYGHVDVRIVDGGRQKWVDEGRPLSTEAPTKTQASYPAKERDERAHGSSSGNCSASRTSAITTALGQSGATSSTHLSSGRSRVIGRAAAGRNHGATVDQRVELKLTDLASTGGCAAKYSAARLERLLAGFVPAEAENLLVGLSPADDAAVYRLDDERALVFTIDFFPPLVDDPADYGAIAATNALNDVFAMGGSPLLALSVAAFPEALPEEAIGSIFTAAERQVRAAGGLLAGGHTILDDEPKYGLAVVGLVHPDGIWPKSGAQPGDALYLTKPLGTGLVLTGFNKGLLGADELAEAVAAMRTLNRDAADALRPLEPSAVTDVTGFGLLGHAYELADRSQVHARIESADLPALPGALAVADSDLRTAGAARNEEFAGSQVSLDGVAPRLVDLAYDPQTAGGLLISLPAARGPVLEAGFRARGLFIKRIGAVEQGRGVSLS
jgi:selenide, water dikinase